MSLSYAIIGPRKTQNTLDLCHAIDGISCTSTVYDINNISLNFKKLSENSFLNHDIYLFRGYNKSITYAHVLSLLSSLNNKIIIDRLLIRTIVRNKLEEALLLYSKNITHPQTLYAQNFTKWNTLLKQANFPIIAKALSGQQGEHIYKLNSLSEAIIFFKKNPNGFLAQEYIESDGDIRVFIVGNKVLGAIKRLTIPGDFRSNASLGAETKPHELTKSEKNIALAAHKCIGYDISGVDIILNKHNKPFILEVNHTPQWQAFKKALNINPAKEIINYSLEKYEEKNRLL